MICKTRLMHIQDTSLCTAAAMYYKRKISCVIWARRNFINTWLSLFVSLWMCKRGLGILKVSSNILYCVTPLTFSHNVENYDQLTAYKCERDKKLYGFTDMSEMVILYYLWKNWQMWVRKLPWWNLLCVKYSGLNNSDF